METFTLMYKKKLTKQIVLQSLNARLDSTMDETAVRSCCGSLAYLSLFLLPEYELEDKKVYSIENVCTFVPGIFTLFMHEILESLGNIACGINVHESLKRILGCTGFYECFDLLGLIPRIWYRVFLREYLGNKVRPEVFATLQTYDSLCTLFYNMEEGEAYSG